MVAWLGLGNHQHTLLTIARTLLVVALLAETASAQLRLFGNNNRFARKGDDPSNAQTNTGPYRVGPMPVAPAGTDQLMQYLDDAIAVTKSRKLIANHNTPWQIFHGLLAVRKDFQLKNGDQVVNAIDWISTANPHYDNQPMIHKTPYGAKFHSFTKKYLFEGHPSQFLALMSQSELPLDHVFKTSQGDVTLKDILNNTMMEVNTREEITWVLWGLTQYLDPAASWTNAQGEAWSMERLVQIQVESPVVGTACGGNHGLFALVRARNKFLAKGNQLSGVWLMADRKVNQYVEIARSLQNTDGSMSADFHRGPKFSNDLNTRLTHSGHTLEFLSIGLPKNRLNEQWVRAAYSSLAHDVYQSRLSPAEPGPLYHSLNALILYRERLKEVLPPSQLPENIAKATPSATNNPAQKPIVAVPAPSTSNSLKKPQSTAAIEVVPRPISVSNIPRLKSVPFTQQGSVTETDSEEGPVSALVPENLRSILLLIPATDEEMFE